MSTDQNAHASLSGTLPENPQNPTLQGKRNCASYDPLEIRIARQILQGGEDLPPSPYDVGHLADAAADEADGASTRHKGMTVFCGFDGLEVDASEPAELRKTLVELSIREALRFSEMVQGQDSPVRYSISFRHELHRCVNRELAHLLQEWGEAP